MFTTTITPRISETDGMGHINNTMFPVWFEAARHELFLLFEPELSFTSWPLIMASYTVNCHAEVMVYPDVTIHTEVERIGNSSLVLKESLHQSGQLCVTSTAVYVNVDPATKTPTRISEHHRALLAPHFAKAQEAEQ